MIVEVDNDFNITIQVYLFIRSYVFDIYPIKHSTVIVEVDYKVPVSTVPSSRHYMHSLLQGVPERPGYYTWIRHNDYYQAEVRFRNPTFEKRRSNLRNILHMDSAHAPELLIYRKF